MALTPLTGWTDFGMDWTDPNSIVADGLKWYYFEALRAAWYERQLAGRPWNFWETGFDDPIRQNQPFRTDVNAGTLSKQWPEMIDAFLESALRVFVNPSVNEGYPFGYDFANEEIGTPDEAMREALDLIGDAEHIRAARLPAWDEFDANDVPFRSKTWTAPWLDWAIQKYKLLNLCLVVFDDFREIGGIQGKQFRFASSAANWPSSSWQNNSSGWYRCGAGYVTSELGFTGSPGWIRHRSRINISGYQTELLCRASFWITPEVYRRPLQPSNWGSFDDCDDVGIQPAGTLVQSQRTEIAAFSFGGAGATLLEKWVGDISSFPNAPTVNRTGWEVKQKDDIQPPSSPLLVDINRDYTVSGGFTFLP